MEIPSDYYKPSAHGCASAITSFTGLVAGIYHGINDSMGKPVTPGLENLLMYGPSIAGAVLGPQMTTRMMNDPRIRAQLPPMSQEPSKGCTGCIGLVSGAVVPAVANYIGYLIGGYIGNQVK